MVQVIGHVVNANNVMHVHMVADKYNAVLLFIGECMLISVVWKVILARQKMVLESWDEVLVIVSYALRL